MVISNPQRHAIMETEILCLGLIYILMRLCALTHQKDERLFCFHEDARMFPSGAEVAFPLKKNFFLKIEKQCISSFLLLCFA